VGIFAAAQLLGAAELVEPEPMTTAQPIDVPRAKERDEIAPLLALCRAGRLFDVQAWIAAGKPVNPPPKPPKGARVRSPLDVALDLGFHSLIEVLLKAGAQQDPPSGYGSPLSRALEARRLDIIELLVEHGCDPRSVDMVEVLRSWDPAIFRFFIERGADVTTGQPFAHAFCEGIWTAMRPFKELSVTRPELLEQANIALRHHCKEGDIKWVAQLLRAGADPQKPGADAPGRSEEAADYGLSALGYAALYQHYEVFDLKQVRTLKPDVKTSDYLAYLHRGAGTEVMRRLLEAGLQPNDQEDGGCSILHRLIESLSWGARFRTNHFAWEVGTSSRKYDSEESRDTMKAIHLLAKHGARWMPKGKREIGSARRSLLQMTPDYTMEFVWIMSKYRACELNPIKELLGTPAMKTHTASHRPRLSQILERWET
jgi:ankyrin repeat protein